MVGSGGNDTHGKGGTHGLDVGVGERVGIAGLGVEIGGDGVAAIACDAGGASDGGAGGAEGAAITRSSGVAEAAAGMDTVGTLTGPAVVGATEGAATAGEAGAGAA